MINKVKRWKRKWREILVSIISYVGIFWLFVEIASYSTDGKIDVYLKRIDFFVAIFLFILIIAFLINRPKRCFGYTLRGRDSYIEIRVGDAFENKGALVVPVNNYFDMSLGGNVVKANSIQNQLIKKYYLGKAEHLETDIAKKIASGKKYEIGKTVEIEQNGKKFYLVVNTLRQKNNHVKSEIDDFIQTLNGIWQYIAMESSRDNVITIPLINTQHGRDSYLTRAGSIKEIIASYVEMSKNLNICEKLIISIHPNDLERGNIDLDEIDDYLKFSCNHYRQLTMKEKIEDGEKISKIVKIDN